MSEKKIEGGDRVVVVFGNGDQLSGEVLYTPVATGDCWIIKGKVGLFHIQQFQSIYRPNP
jgi:hypothetical protein